MGFLKANNRSLIFLLIVIYKLLLDYLYMFYISKIYAFYHFYGNFSFPVYVLITVVFLIITALFVKNVTTRNGSVSSVIFLAIYLISGVPFFSMAYSGYDSNYVIANIVFWFLFVLLFGLFNKRIKQQKVSVGKKNSIIIYSFGFFFSLIIFFVSFRYAGLRLSFNLANAYMYRTDSDNFGLPGILAYLYQWARIIVPLALCLSVKESKVPLALFFILVQALNFGIDGMKVTILITAIALFFPIILKFKPLARINVFLLVPLLFCLVCVASIVEHCFKEVGTIDTLITFRTLFLPNLIQSWFYDFFTKNTPDYFRSSFLRHFGFESPYSSVGIDYMISGIYFGDYSCRGNSGLLADAMTNFGVLGIVVYPIMTNIVFYLIDKNTKGVCEELRVVLGAYFGSFLSNNFLLIILLTNGLIIATIVLYLYSRKGKVISFLFRGAGKTA